MCFEGTTVTPPLGPARNKPLTGQHSCRQPTKVIVVKQLLDFFVLVLHLSSCVSCSFMSKDIDPQILNEKSKKSTQYKSEL